MLDKDTFKKSLINDSNVNLMKPKEKTQFNIKRLLNNNNLTQQQCIIFGYVFEFFVKNLIISSTRHTLMYENLIDVYNTKSKTKKDKKEVDLCFTHKDIIYYFECKTNLNLDSEKSKATDQKIQSITEYLKNKYSNNLVISGILSPQQEQEKGIKNTTKTKTYFMKDFCGILNIEYSIEEYYKLMSDFGSIIQ